LRHVTHSTDNATVPTGGDEAARSGVCLLDLARGKDLAVLDAHHTEPVRADRVPPNSRHEIPNCIDDVAVAVVAKGPVRPLRRVANDRNAAVDQQVEPVARLLQVGATIQPDAARVLAVAQRVLDNVRQTSQGGAGGMANEVVRLVREELLAKSLRRDIA